MCKYEKTWYLKDDIFVAELFATVERFGVYI